MSARIPIARPCSAAEMAEQLGVSERQVRSIHAQPRDEYLAAAADRRRRAAELRADGASYTEIAAVLGTTRGAVSSLLYHARRHGEMPMTVAL